MLLFLNIECIMMPITWFIVPRVKGITHNHGNTLQSVFIPGLKVSKSTVICALSGLHWGSKRGDKLGCKVYIRVMEEHTAHVPFFMCQGQMTRLFSIKRTLTNAFHILMPLILDKVAPLKTQLKLSMRNSHWRLQEQPINHQKIIIATLWHQKGLSLFTSVNSQLCLTSGRLGTVPWLLY